MAAGDITLKQYAPGTRVGVWKSSALGDFPSGVAAVPPDATATADASGVTAFSGLSAEKHWAAPAPVSAVKTLTVNATAGTFRLRYGVDTTLDLAYNISAANLQAALRGLPSIGAGNVTVTGGPGDSGGTTPYVITFASALASKPVGTLEVLAGATALSGGGAVATVADTTPGTSGGGNYVGFLPDLA